MQVATGWTSRDIPSLKDKVAVVTGANRGLGLEIAAELAAAGATVVMACRDPERAQSGLAEVRRRVLADTAGTAETMALDLGNLSSVRRFADRYTHKFSRLDILCHNAAAILAPLGKTRDGFETHIGTNHLGAFALTGLLLGPLWATPGARVVSTSSIAHRLTPGLDFDDLHFERKPYKGMDAYGKSKLAALLFNFELGRRLQKADAVVMATAAHPGYTATNLDMGGFFMRLSTRLFAQAPAQGALPALYAATAPAARNGEFYGPGGFKQLTGYPVRVQSRPEAQDAAVAARLWDVSQELTGVRYL